MEQRARESQGFTLIELLTVVAIIAILAAMLFPVLDAAKQRAQVSKIRQELDSLQTGLQSYYMDKGSYPSWDDPGWTSLLYPYYIKLLIDTNYLTVEGAKKFRDTYADPSWGMNGKYHYYVAKANKWNYTDAGGTVVNYPVNETAVVFSVGPDEHAFGFLDESDNGKINEANIRYIFYPPYSDMNNDGIHDFDYRDASFKWTMGSPLNKTLNNKNLPNNPANPYVVKIANGDEKDYDGIILLVKP